MKHRMGAVMHGIGIVLLCVVVVVAVMGVMAAMAMTTDLIWQPNSESDLAGYRVYGKSPCGDPNALPKIADVGNVTNFRYVGPDADTEFEVTAYDTSGNESGRSNRSCKYFTLTYFKKVTDSSGNLWGLVGDGPKYRIYKNGADFLPGEPLNNASDVRLNNGVPEFKGTDGDETWYVYVEGKGWQPAHTDKTPPSAPVGLEAK